MPIQPYTLFHDSVVKELQKPPLNWVGKSGFDLAEKYKNIINSHWQDDGTPPQCAEAINDMQMGISQKCVSINFTNPTICIKRVEI